MGSRAIPEIQAGTLLADRYQIELRLGAGWHGAVYRAVDTKFKTPCALKVSEGNDEEFKTRFRREAWLGNKLGKAPGFVRAFDWGELPGHRLYLAMDLVDGATPLDLKSGTLEERVRRLIDASRLVASAHDEGVIHRDLKPANFLVDPSGQIFLADFGLAKAPGDEDAPARIVNLTQTGKALGTIHYMPPEQFEDARAVDARSDVYALGVMLFQAITGLLPYEGKNGSAVYSKQLKVRHGQDPAPRPSDHVREVPPAIDTVCAQAMCLDSSLRTPSATAFVKRVERALEEGEVDPVVHPSTDLESVRPATPVKPAGPTPVGPGPTPLRDGSGRLRTLSAFKPDPNARRPNPEPHYATLPQVPRRGDSGRQFSPLHAAEAASRVEAQLVQARARVAWGHDPDLIRKELSRLGLPYAEIERVIAEALAERDAEFREKGRKNVMTAIPVMGVGIVLTWVSYAASSWPVGVPGVIGIVAAAMLFGTGYMRIRYGGANEGSSSPL